MIVAQVASSSAVVHKIAICSVEEDRRAFNYCSSPLRDEQDAENQEVLLEHDSP